MLQNAYLLVKIGFDTAENEPSTIWRTIVTFFSKSAIQCLKEGERRSVERTVRPSADGAAADGGHAAASRSLPGFRKSLDFHFFPNRSGDVWRIHIVKQKNGMETEADFR